MLLIVVCFVDVEKAFETVPMNVGMGNEEEGRKCWLDQ